MAPKAPKGAPRGPQEVARKSQEAPRMPPRGSPKRPQETPRDTQDAPRGLGENANSLVALRFKPHVGLFGGGTD
eukprot:7746531-Pyramimonas_sp.AAC.1